MTGPTGPLPDPTYGGPAPWQPPPTPPWQPTATVTLKKNAHPAVVITACLATLFLVCFGGFGALAAIAPASAPADAQTTARDPRPAAGAQAGRALLTSAPAAT